jgi:hypothetical protein
MPLGKFLKTPVEVKRYSIEYDEWLDTGEYISNITFQIVSQNTGTLVVAPNTVQQNAKALVFFVSGGNAGQNYEVALTMTTTGNQVKQDTITFQVKALT